MDLIALPLLGFLAFLIWFLVKSYSSSPPLRLPPGPWQLPLVGSLHHVLLSRSGDLPHRALRELAGRHGPLMMLRFGAVPTLVVSSAEAAREVLKIKDATFASRHLTPTLAVFSRGGRDILFSPYGDLWRHLRRLCVLELFSARRVQSFRQIREDEAARLLRSVADQCAHGIGASAEVDIGERISRMVNDSVVRSAVGGRCARRDEFLHELDKSVKLTGGSNLADLYPSSRLARRLSGALRETERCNRNVRTIIDDIIREHANDSNGEEDLLGVLLRLQRDGGEQGPLTTEIITTVVLVLLPGRFLLWAFYTVKIDDLIDIGGNPTVATAQELQGYAHGTASCITVGPSSRRYRRWSSRRRCPCCGLTSWWRPCWLVRGRRLRGMPEIFAAGSETSSTTLEWAMSELMKNPRVLEKATAEVRETFKGQDKVAEVDVEKLSYLHLVIRETLRMHAPAPFLLPRQCREPCQVMGYHIPEGTKVLVNAWAIGRDSRYWQDPEAFKPERFETNGADFNGADFEYIPFGSGRRMCPGMALGLANMELALASLLYHFDWEVPGGKRPEELDMSEAFGITVRRKRKLVLLATPRITCAP